MSSLVHLHRHSEYSLLDGCGSNKLYAERAAEMGQFALALTDHGTLAGALHHMNACRDAGVLPIVGCEAYFRPNRKVQGIKELRYESWHMVLLAKDARGWLNLMRLISEAWSSGYYQKPCVDPEILMKYREGIICGTACIGGVLAQRILAGDSTGADNWLWDLKKIFGDDLFIEIMPSHVPEQVEANPDIVSVANQHGIMVCATADAHAPYEIWAPTQDVLLMINTGTNVKEREAQRAKGEDVFEFNDPTFFLQSEEQMRGNFASHHQALSKDVIDSSIKNTLEIASRISPFLIGRHDKLPKFKREKPDIDLLRELSFAGLKRHGTDQKQEYVDRLNTELDAIDYAGIAPYLLMVHDIVEWSTSDRGFPDKDGYEAPGEKIPIEVGPGRGSAAGSLVSDSIGITNMDPIAYRLLFERFYNINRKGLPDIDVDFPRDRIDEVEKYTKMRFGKDHVLDVISHQTFGPRASIRKVGGALRVPFNDIDVACKSLDVDDRSPLEEIRVVNDFVDKIATEYPEAWEHMTRIQGQVQGRSEHAAALLVTPPEMPLQDVIPMERVGGQNGKMITAWGERAGAGNTIISDYGFMKFDWLRVAELDKQVFACKLIEERTSEKIELNKLGIHRDPYDVDAEVMAGFSRGLLTGVFQFSATAAKLTRRLKPDNIFDLAAINALIRPGPRGALVDQDYVARKNGEQEVTYWHEKLEPYLDYTQGLMVFQEQLVQAVQHLGGLKATEADNFRKIASKLYRDPEYARETMGKWYEPIKAGFMENGITEEEFGHPGFEGEDSTGIWGNFLSFSDYSFNLAHAAGYALLAYRDMWLKVKYPREFYAAFLSKGLSAIKEKRQQQKESAVREARSLDLAILPPDINESNIDYTVVDDGIRLGLASVKNVKSAAKVILKERERGPFMSYADLEKRIPKKQANIKVKGSLVCAGAFDAFGLRDDYTEEKVDELEREYLGVSLSTIYSATAYADVLESRIQTEDQVEETPDGELVVVAGEVINIKEWNDKKNNRMCFVDLAYGPDEWSITFFSHMYEIYEDLIKSNRPLIIRGKKNSYKGRASILPLSPDKEGESYVHYVQDVAELAKLVREPQLA